MTAIARRLGRARGCHFKAEPEVQMTMEQFREKLEQLIEEAVKSGVDMTDIAVELDETAKALMAAGEG